MAGRQKYIEELEQRVRNLEKREERLRALEKEVGALSAAAPARQSKGAWQGPDVSGRGNWAASIKPANDADPSLVTPVADEVTTAPRQTNSSASATPPALASPEDIDAVRDLQVIRDSAVTVKKGGLDVSGKLDYVRSSSTLQYSQAFIASGSIRYGLLQGVEVSLSVPGYNAVRNTQTGPDNFERTEIRTIGDVSGQVTATLYRETLSLPGIFGYIGVSAPTGPNPYWVESGKKPYAQPINPLYFTQSSGHWGGTTGLTAAKTLEPIIVFAGISYTHFLPADYGGSRIEPGDRYGYKMGLGLAVSERTMLGAAVQGSIAQDLYMDGTVRRGASAEAVLLTLSVTQRLSMGFFLEPSVTMGMTSDAPSATVSISARKSF